MNFNFDPYEIEQAIEAQEEFFDFTKSDIAMEYLKQREAQILKIPKYVPIPLVELYKKIRNLISSQRKPFNIALETLYNNQTEDEKEVFHTKWRNLEGFNKSEAQYLSKMATIAQERPLTINEVATCIPALRKYIVQLMIEAPFMERIGLGYEYRSMVLPFIDEIQEIRRRG